MSKAFERGQSAGAAPHDADTLAKLVSKLRHAAEIEHQFMCMYLYGALSIQKRYVDDQALDPTPAQQEISRRWASMVYLVARQEMEHLALVNNLLRSVGGAPYFARANLSDDPLSAFHLGASPSPAGAPPTATGVGAGPSGAPHRPPCDELSPIPQEFVLSSFDLAAARRWTCMEAPHCEDLIAHDQDQFAEWCFEKSVLRGTESAVDPVQPGTIEDLYDELEELFRRLPASAFVTGADEQVLIEQQYNVFVFPVTDHASATQAMNLVTEQGEGISAQPTYPSHYRRFYDIVREWEANGDFQASWTLLRDPVGSDVDAPYARTLFDLGNHAYETLLIMLTALYATANQKPSKYPYFAPALGMEAFAPFMTMVIRSLGEVLVQLPATNGESGCAADRVGPGFRIGDALNADLRSPYEDGTDGMAGVTLKPIFADIEGIIGRVERFSARLGKLTEGRERPPTLDPALSDWALRRLKYVQANSARIAVNLRRIYQQGVFPALQTEGF